MLLLFCLSTLLFRCLDAISWFSSFDFEAETKHQIHIKAAGNTASKAEKTFQKLTLFLIRCPPFMATVNENNQKKCHDFNKTKQMG